MKLKAQSGSAIIMALMAIGVISSLAVYLMNMSADTNKKVVDDARVVSYKNLVEVVKNKLHSGKVCTEVLAKSGPGGTNLVLTPDAFTRLGMRINSLDLKLGMNTKPLVPFLDKSKPHLKWQLKGGTSIEDIRLVISERFRAPVQLSNKLIFNTDKLKPMVAAKGHILIVPDHDGVGVYLDQNKHYRIPIFLYYEADVDITTLKYCFEPEGEAFICTTSAYGAYDIDELDLSKRCHPVRYCKTNPTGLTSSSTCSSPYDKKTIISVEPQWNACLWCNDDFKNTFQDACYGKKPLRFFSQPINRPYNNETTPFKEFNDLCESPTYTNISVDCDLTCSGSGATTGGGFTGGGFTGGGGGTIGGSSTSGGGGGGGGSGWSCFVAGTEITLFDGTKKNIEDISLGESLIDLKGSKVKVQKLLSYDYTGRIYSINGGPYFFTPNHPFLTTTGWKSLDPLKSMKEAPGLRVSLLKVGDILLKKDGVEIVVSLDFILSKEKVYNFTLDGTHEYLANDYAVHNKLPTLNSGVGGGGTLEPVLPGM